MLTRPQLMMQLKQPLERCSCFAASDFAAGLVGGGEVAVLEVARRQGARLVEDVDEHVGAVGLEAGAADGVRLDELARRHDGGLEAVGIGDLHGAGAVDRDRLEVLGAHDGADAGAAGGAVHLVHDVGDEREMLTGRPDARHLGVFVGLGAHQIGRVLRVVAPDGRGVADLHLVVADPQVRRLGRLALDDDGVVAGVLELGPERAARVGAGDHVVERALGDHFVAARRRRERAGERAGGEDELVVRAQGVGLGIELVADDLAAEAAGPDVVVSHLDVGRLTGHLALGEVDAEDGARPAVHLSSPPGRRP